MFREMLSGKIHRATVTDSDLNYEGSITVDEDLLDAAGMKPYEKVVVVDINNGNRFETYLLLGERGSGMVCVNGAAARLVHRGDLIIIFTYCLYDAAEVEAFSPKVVLVDSQNHRVVQ